MTQRAYRYRFYPTVEQEQLLRCTLGCVRLVYNKALHTRTEAWYSLLSRVGYSETSVMLTSTEKAGRPAISQRSELRSTAAGIEKPAKSFY